MASHTNMLTGAAAWSTLQELKARPTSFRRLIVLLATPSFLMATALSHASPFAYIANQGSNTVSVVDVANNTVLSTVPVGFNPLGVAIRPDGAYAYVTNVLGTVSVIDTATHMVTATVTVGPQPRAVAIAPNGAKAYVTHYPSQIASVIDVASNAVTSTLAIDNPRGLAFTPDGAYAYVATSGFANNVSIISTATDSVVATVTTVGGTPTPIGVAITPDGSYAYVTNAGPGNVSVIATADNTVVATVTVGSSPREIAITPDGAYVYVANAGSGTVSVIAIATNSVTTTVPVGANPIGVAITPDGAYAYVTNHSSNTLSVINTASNTVIATVAVGANPHSIAITPADFDPSTVSTSSGSLVAVTPVVTLPNGTGVATVELIFDNVLSGGTTSAATAVTPTGGAPGSPPGFKVGTPPVYYDISTTATFVGSVTLCFSWREGEFNNENNIKLFHFESELWLDVTTSLDTDANKVCGQVSSLSPFALFEKSYVFSGFFSPVDNPPIRNVAKSGSAIPIKFSLHGNQGLTILAAGYPMSQITGCTSGVASDAVEETVSTGGNGLSYDIASDQYTYVWKTQKAWTNSCRRLVLTLADGSEHTADFAFEK